MSSPNPRRPPQGDRHTPPPRLSIPSTYSVEPKSDLLRSALEARRARDTPITSSPTETRPPLRRASSLASSIDPWMDQSVLDDESPKQTPFRQRRRPSEGAVPRMLPQQSLHNENEKLKSAMFDLNMKLQLLRDQNNQLKDQMEEANRRLEELEPLEEENIELQQANNDLRLRLGDMEETIFMHEEDRNELLEINSELVCEMENKDKSFEEAVDIVADLEAKMKELVAENEKLKQVHSSADSAYGSAHVDGESPHKIPTRIYSIDESRPSTSHFDSDYYSQPGSPQVKPKPSKETKEPKETLEIMERVKSIKHLSQDKRSFNELKKRTSDVSLKMAPRPHTPLPAVPQIPAQYDVRRTERAIRRPDAKMESQRQPTPLPIREAPIKPVTKAPPRTPTTPHPGLRDLFRDSTSVSRPLPKSPASSSRYRQTSRKAYSPEPYVTPPQRQSSRNAPTTNSGAIEESRTDAGVSEWDPRTMPTPSTVADDEDLITEPGTNEKWWKDTANLYGKNRGDIFAPSTSAIRHRNQERRRSNGAAVHIGGEFFNMSENEDAFLARALRRSEQHRKKG
ncbi:hypothetical protein P154DRAFT_261531 [Amniculicola lignicola CBS 123094]|uniref:Centrosomin N-terminal motif 1 domain-containing protein n=1 Tax=Amniculicola lignicola CBS 123094 TaxID=1392246 RepID=A0A6A5WKR9_9PLEO|nr:hypothetical protein P154DRAFT_261531 [Amniculicola lignicola CBS 123094]